MLAAGAHDSPVTQQPQVHDLGQRRRSERRHGTDFEGRKVALELPLGGKPQMMSRTKRLARPPQVEPLGRRNDGQPIAIVVTERDGLAVASGSASVARASAAAEYVSSCSTIS